MRRSGSTDRRWAWSAESAFRSAATLRDAVDCDALGGICVVAGTEQAESAKAVMLESAATRNAAAGAPVARLLGVVIEPTSFDLGEIKKRHRSKCKLTLLFRQRICVQYRTRLLHAVCLLEVHLKSKMI